jgi:hypothetical protein
MAATVTHAKTEEPFEKVFSMGSVLKLYKEGQLPLQKSRETVVGRVGGLCEMAASLVVDSCRNALVVGQSLAGRNVSTKAEDPS